MTIVSSFPARRGAVVIGVVCLALAACTPGPPAPTQAEPTQALPSAGSLPADCAITLSRTVAFTAAEPGDVLEARSLAAPRCEEAALIFTLRGRDGALLHVFAAPFAQLAQGAPPDALRPTLEAWLAAGIDDTAAAPAWIGPADAFPAAFGPTGSTPLLRSTYEGVRAQKRPRLCYPTSYEASACIYSEAESGHVGLLYQTGP